MLLHLPSSCANFLSASPILKARASISIRNTQVTNAARMLFGCHPKNTRLTFCCTFSSRAFSLLLFFLRRAALHFLRRVAIEILRVAGARCCESVLVAANFPRRTCMPKCKGFSIGGAAPPDPPRPKAKRPKCGPRLGSSTEYG